MENKKKCETKFSLKRFSNINFKKKREKKKRRKKRNKEGKTQFVINYRTPSHEPNNSTCFLPVPRRKISNMILIIRRNISSNGYNQYY